MKYKIDHEQFVFGEQSIAAQGDVVKSDDDWATQQLVGHFETTLPLTQSAIVIAQAMAVLALQIAQHDAAVVSAMAQVGTLLDSPSYQVEL